MTGHRHLISMLVAGGGVLGALWIAGVPISTAAPLALFLACPVMMFFMMRGMDHNPQADPIHHQDGHRAEEPPGHR